MNVGEPALWLAAGVAVTGLLIVIGTCFAGVIEGFKRRQARPKVASGKNRFCRDCKHSEKLPNGQLAAMPYCHHPLSVVIQGRVNLVTGAPPKTVPQYCSNQRDEPVGARKPRCGPEGKWFEAAK